MKTFPVAPIRMAPKGARTAWVAAAAGGASRAAAGRRTATSPARRTAAATWVSAWPAVSLFSSSDSSGEAEPDPQVAEASAVLFAIASHITRVSSPRSFSLPGAVKSAGVVTQSGL